MVLRLKNIFLMVAFIATALSCAEEVEVNTTDAEIESLRAWMVKNLPEYEEAEDGLFYKITRGERIGQTPDSFVDWVSAKYKLTDLHGNYYVNSYKPLAKHLATFKYSTHFVPVFARYFPEGKMMTPGIWYTLGKMQESDSVDIVMSSQWAAGAAEPLPGFAGAYTYSDINNDGTIEENVVPIPSGQPLMVSLKFESMTNDPERLEENKVIQYAMSELSLNHNDTITTGLYYKIIDPKPQGDTLSVDTTVYLQYTGRFLDGFVFDTNVESVAKENNLNKSYASWKFQYSESGNIKGFNEVVKKMRVGETAIAVFTSEYGYGETGNGSIQPYDPLVFEIKVLTAEETDEFPLGTNE